MEKELEQEILDISNRLNKLSDANAKEFIVHCSKSVKEVIGEKFNIANYSYEVVSTDKVPETQREDGEFQSDIWITIKPTPPRLALRLLEKRRMNTWLFLAWLGLCANIAIMLGFTTVAMFTGSEVPPANMGQVGSSLLFLVFILHESGLTKRAAAGE